MTRTRRHTLNLSFAGSEPPTEFRIFTAGAVETSKGTFIFDEAAAQAVMAEYALQGNEMMVDYDHASLASVALDPATAGKAAAWFDLELRGGELWAVNVRWTPPAATALRAKEWRYMSPAFSTDESGRICALMNVAITNLPATRNLQPLMAASIHALGASMDPNQVKAALEAIAAGDTEKCAEILKALIAAAASGEAASEPAPDAGAAAASVAAAEAPPAAATDDGPPDSKKDEDKNAVAASIAKLCRLSGKKSIVASVADVEVWRASHIELEEGRAANAKERATLESAERRKGCADLVVKAGRAPATVWADDKATNPKAYLLSMPIADFRAYVLDQIKASTGGSKTPKVPTTGEDEGGSKEFSTPNGTVTLSASELAECKRAGAKPEVFAANKGLRIKRSGAKGSV